MKDNQEATGLAGLIALVVLFLFIGFIMWAWPTYGVWRADKAGEAELRRATQQKKIMVEQAQAEVESAKLRAQAIESVGAAAQKYPEYREQEFIGAFAEALQQGNVSQIIYVPTEANIPIIEAGHR